MYRTLGARSLSKGSETDIAVRVPSDPPMGGLGRRTGIPPAATIALHELRDHPLRSRSPCGLAVDAAMRHLCRSVLERPAEGEDVY